ncbi:MAG TPA: hypothetical protein DEF01_07600 [Gemmatimonadetes bacterium]|nr:hypothetical protein [Gemmatimonadota bacterium]HCO13859.1 hypothetical protein [Gemmatimonadota bacterium]
MPKAEHAIDSPNDSIRSRLWDGTVIMLSILAAFGLDASWGTLQERRVEATLKSELAVELMDAADRIQENIGYLEKAGGAIQQILHLQGPHPEVIAEDSLVSLLVTATTTYTLDMPSSVVQSVVTTDQLSIIQEPELRRALSRWPVLVTDVLENHEWIIEGFRNEFVSSVSRWAPLRNQTTESFERGNFSETGPFRAPGKSRFGVNVEGLLSDQNFEQVLSHRYMWLNLTALESKSLLEATRGLVAMLNAE